MSNETHTREEDLQLYALGALAEAEATELRLHVAGCSVCANKLAEWRGHAALLAFDVAQETPSAAAKDKLFARIAAERETGARGRMPLRGADTRRAVRWWNWVLVPATAVMALLSFGLWRQNNRLFAELQEAQRVAANLERERVRVQKLVNVLAAPETITVKLASPENAAGASGVVKYDRRTGVVVYTAQLPALPAEKVYQMWLVPASGAPISAGIFVPGAAGSAHVWSAEVPGDTEPKAFAVTIEPAGGLAQPSGPKVLLGAS